LPTPDTALNLLDFGSHSVDLDLGEMFLNFPLAQELRQESGIDLTPFRTDLNDLVGDRTRKKKPKVELTKEERVSMEEEERKHTLWLRWERNWMGARPSPHSSVRFCYLAEEFVRGDPAETKGPLRWDDIVLNLPGDASYDPSRPRVMKWDFHEDRLAGDFVAFVDDLRASGATEEHAWAVAMRIAKRLQYLGIQNAARKTRPPTREPGAWAGAVFRVYLREIVKTVTQEKWDKAKRLIDELDESMGPKLEDDSTVDYKQLETIRGFMCHIGQTFTIVMPFLKGFHLTLSSHLPGRNSEGWKLGDRAWRVYQQDRVDRGELLQEEMDAEHTGGDPDREPPQRIKPVPRLYLDLVALKFFFSGDKPPEVSVRSRNVKVLLYGFGDASGRGFGSTVLTPLGVRYRIGTWGPDDEGESSNWKEFENVVETVECEAAEGTLKGAVMFLFTDNSTVEAALYKGNSSSPKLYNLILRLRGVEMREGAAIHVSHVSGKRMMAEGADGVSRGQMKEGVAAGESMLGFIPLNTGALERHPPLRKWLESWVGPEAEFLDPRGWFTRGHGTDGGEKDEAGFWRPFVKPGTFVWTPPPAAARIALEELRKSVLKRPTSTHVFVCPRLLTPEWRKMLHKASDLVFYIPAGTEGWPADMYEPLTVGIVFPFINRCPWQLRGTPKMLHLARTMPRVFENTEVAPGDFLRELRVECQGLLSVPEHVVRRVLYFGQDPTIFRG
jgi:hypothetical protein